MTRADRIYCIAFVTLIPAGFIGSFLYHYYTYKPSWRVDSQPANQLTADESTDNCIGRYGHALRAKVYVDGRHVHSVGADTHRELEEVLRSVAVRFCVPIRQYDESGNLVPLPRVEVHIWDTQREQWVRPDGSAMPDSRLLPMKVTVHVGNANL